MIVTKTRQVANQVMKMTGRGEMIFNDKLKYGIRSLKVWGWHEGDYDLAAQMLRDQGCHVHKVVFTGEGWSPIRYTQCRLHVLEPRKA